MTTATEHCYIGKNPEILSGEPIIKGTRASVRAIVEVWRMGIPPEEIPLRLPHLWASQVFGALSYYSDHMDEINGYIDRNSVADSEVEPLVREIGGRI